MPSSAKAHLKRMTLNLSHLSVSNLVLLYPTVLVVQAFSTLESRAQSNLNWYTLLVLYWSLAAHSNGVKSFIINWPIIPQSVSLVDLIDSIDWTFLYSPGFIIALSCSSTSPPSLIVSLEELLPPPAQAWWAPGMAMSLSQDHLQQRLCWTRIPSHTRSTSGSPSGVASPSRGSWLRL